MFDNFRMKRVGFARSVTKLTGIGLFVLAAAGGCVAQGKNPVILIPGLSGTELRHKETNERIWFRTFRSKSEDLRLPLTADVRAAGDDLVPGDILREVKIGILPVTDVYGGFIKAMRLRGGYHEEKWVAPSDGAETDSLFVFTYDWRLDTVENARRLIRTIEVIKRRLDRPELRFDVVAHSMGGLITRYAAMYGDQDLPPDGKNAKPTWAGARHFGRIVLMGTPNEGSVSALSSLINGFTIGGLRIDLPFVQDTSKFTIFSVPSAYQLLPAPGTLRAFDENLEPLSIDLFDPKTWAYYGWSAFHDPKFGTEFRSVKVEDAERHFAANLKRARSLHLALSAEERPPQSLAFHMIGADCHESGDGIVVHQGPGSDKWNTVFLAKGFTTSRGKKVESGEVRRVVYGPGDGVVTYRSLRGAGLTERTSGKPILDPVSQRLICADHNKLAADKRVQEHVVRLLAEPLEVSARH